MNTDKSPRLSIIDRIDFAIDSRLSQTPDAIKRRKNRIWRPLGGLASGLLVIGGGALCVEAYDSLDGPDFSKETTTYTLDSNEGLSHAAAHVKGIENVDTRDVQNYIAHMPQNIDVLLNGLQVDDTVVIPVEVTD